MADDYFDPFGEDDWEDWREEDTSFDPEELDTEIGDIQDLWDMYYDYGLDYEYEVYEYHGTGDTGAEG
jgi:hypothetical protein